MWYTRLFLRRRLHKLRHKLTDRPADEKNGSIDKSVPFQNSLTPQEKAAFDILLSNSLKQEFTSIDELNRILGTKNKDAAIQKNIRAEVLLKLNEKFQVYAATNDLLVERERTDFDKRVYHYRINQQYLNRLKAM